MQAAQEGSDAGPGPSTAGTAEQQSQQQQAQQQEQGGSTLYVGNLHPLCSSKSLEECCKLFGNVEEVKIVKDRSTNANAGFAFVRFASRSSAVAALKALNGKSYLGQALRVHWAFQSPQAREDTSLHHHVFVGDLGQEVTDGMLYSTACAIGDCSDARVMWDHATGRSKGYGFLSFRNRADAEAAVQRLNGQVIGSRRVRCGWAQHKQDDGPPPDFQSVDKADPFNTNVYVGNTPPGWNEQDLLRFFSAFGDIVEVKLHKKGAYGFVRFAQHADAVKAIINTHANLVEGRQIKCSWGKASVSASATAQANTAGLMMMPALQPIGLPAGGLLHHNLLASPLMLSAQQQQVLPGMPGLQGIPLGLAGQMQQMQQMQQMGQMGQMQLMAQQAPNQSAQLAFLGRSQPGTLSFPLDPTAAGAYYNPYYQ